MNLETMINELSFWRSQVRFGLLAPGQCYCIAGSTQAYRIGEAIDKARPTSEGRGNTFERAARNALVELRAQLAASGESTRSVDSVLASVNV